MLHILPSQGYINHGFYNFQPGLFYDIARANGYDILRLSVGNTKGDEYCFTSVSENLTTRKLATFELKEATRTVLSWPGLRNMNNFFKRGRLPLSRAIRSLTLQRANMVTMALLRKTTDEPVRTPVQGVYSGENISSPDLAKLFGRY